MIGKVSVPTAASKDGIVKDLDYYGFEGVDPAAIEAATGRVLIDARRNMGEMVLDARKNLGEMQLRALCKKVAIDCVDTYPRIGKTVVTVDLTLRASENNSDYKREDTWNYKGKNLLQTLKPVTWKNKGKDLIDETLAEFGFQTKSIDYYCRQSNPFIHELNVRIEGLKEEA